MLIRPDLVASPVLVGRDDFLALADRRVAEVATGRGHVLFLAGEAGIGKTRMLTSISRRAEQSGFVVLRGAAFRGDEDGGGGVLLDLAGDLQRSSLAPVRSVGAALAQRSREPLPADGDRHRQRRLLVQDLVELLTDLTNLTEPSDHTEATKLLLVLEDLHWADELSLAVVSHLAARIAHRPTFLVGAYRSDELYPHSVAREWRQRLLAQRLAEECRLPRLTIEQTATLTSSVLGRAAPMQLVTAIQSRSDGIPLHVEELLAAVDDRTAATDPDGALTSLRVPETMADAVLLRAGELDGATREVAAAAAVIGRSFDFDLLVEVTGLDPALVDRCLRQLQSVYLVQAGSAPESFDFRHALIRDALYSEIPLPERRDRHERVARAAVRRGYQNAFVSMHFDEARLNEPAHRYAQLAAHEASGVSAHREALGLYRRALRAMPPDLTPHDHATLLANIGAQAAAVDENAAAAEAFAAAHSIWSDSGDVLRAAGVVAPLVAVSHLLGDGLERRVSRLREAVATLDDSPAAERVKAQLLSGLAAAYMLDRELDQAIEYGERSRELSRAVADDEAGLNTAVTLGSVLLFAGQMEPGWALLEDAVSRSVALGYEAEAARGHRMIGSSASVLVEYDAAERWLTRGIAYADAVELWNHRSYMTAHLAHVQWACGDWESAALTAEHALADGRGGITTRITALYVLGYLAMGRGDDARATALLEEALAAGESMGELQRISPPLWGLAESALLRGDHQGAMALCERGFDLSLAVRDAAYLFPFLVTGTRARLALGDAEGASEWVGRVEAALRHRSIPGTLPAVTHAEALVLLATGERDRAATGLRAAADAWAGRRRFWEGGWARLDEARCALEGRRIADAASLASAVRGPAELAGAATLVVAADALLDQPDQRSQQPWHPLTAREYDVARLVAEGLTNREIAARLVLSPKTVSAHVEHILPKLGAARRAEIATWATRLET